jgi:hypothetical protein
MRRCAGALVSLVALGSLAIVSSARAADSPVGTWVKKTEAGESPMTLTIEKWGNGQGKLSWLLRQQNLTLTILSNLDGNDAPLLINGKPSGETMAIKLVDKRHSTTVVKINGKPFGTSKGSFSEDFRTLTVENDFSASVAGNKAGKTTETWTRK